MFSNSDYVSTYLYHLFKINHAKLKMTNNSLDRIFKPTLCYLVYIRATGPIEPFARSGYCLYFIHACLAIHA